MDFLFVTFMDFLGGGCNFNCSWDFFSSSGHVFPWGLVAQRLRLEVGYRRVVCYAIDDLEKLEAWLTRIDEYSTLKRQLMTGLWGRYLGAGRCSVAPPLAGHGWPIWEMASIALFFIFWKSMEIAGRVQEWRKVPSSTVTGLELRGQGPWGFLPMQHINNWWDWGCSQLQVSSG